MKNLKILAYHKVNPSDKDSLAVSPVSFERQVLYLREKGYQFLTLEKLYGDYLEKGKKIEKKTCLITFDDGYSDNYTFVLPILKKYKIKATIFLTYDFINKANMLAEKEIKEMKECGIEFASHTLSHPDLTKISIDEAKKEIEEAKEKLEGLLSGGVVSFCYPFGYFNKGIAEQVKVTGHKLAVVTPRSSGIRETMFSLKRIGIYKKDENFLRFKIKMSRFFNLLRGLKFLI